MHVLWSIDRLILGVIMATFVYYTPAFQRLDKSFPWYFYAFAVGIYALHQICLYNMYVSLMSLFAQISDPKIGGTYMTLLNTLSNLGRTRHSLSREHASLSLLGGNWSSTGVLFAADYLTWRKCSLGGKHCRTASETETCTSSGGVCRSYIDAYYIETFICTIAGIIWLIWKYRTLMRLQNLPVAAWQVRSNRRKTKLLEDDDDPSSIIHAWWSFFSCQQLLTQHKKASQLISLWWWCPHSQRLNHFILRTK